MQEFGLKILHLSPDGGPISRVTLALATANLNSRIRNGLSAQELWTQRDQLTGMQQPVEDRQFILQQNLNRHYSHASSAKAKAHRSTQTLPTSTLQVGDLVFLKGDKTMIRDKYLITSISDDSDWCQLRKFTRSQFRSKTYDIHLCEYYLALPTTLPGSTSGPI